MKYKIFLILLLFSNKINSSNITTHICPCEETLTQKALLILIKYTLSEERKISILFSNALIKKLEDFQSMSLGESIRQNIHPYTRTIECIRDLNDPVETYKTYNQSGNLINLTRVFIHDYDTFKILQDLFAQKQIFDKINLTNFIEIYAPKNSFFLSKNLPFFDIHTPIKKYTFYYIDIVQKLSI